MQIKFEATRGKGLHLDHSPRQPLIVNLLGANPSPIQHNQTNKNTGGLFSYRFPQRDEVASLYCFFPFWIRNNANLLQSESRGSTRFPQVINIHPPILKSSGFPLYHNHSQSGYHRSLSPLLP